MKNISKTRYLLIMACIALTGYSAQAATGDTGKSANNERKDLPTIDVTKKKYPVKKIFTELEYIPLETNDSTLVSRSEPDLVSDKYIVFHNKDGQILVFSRQGKILYTFNHQGEGPEEYYTVSSLVLDEEKEELYVSSIEGTTKIFVYSIDGTFKRRLVLSKRFYPGCLMNYDKDYLFCYDYYFADKPKVKIRTEDIPKRDNPYYFISKQTGKMVPLKYNIPNRMGNMIYQLNKDQTIKACVGMDAYPVARNSSEILISEFADDTLYFLEKGKLLPAMIKRPSAHKETPPIMVSVYLFTDRYIFINTFEKEFEQTPGGDYIVYDRKEKAFYRPNLLKNTADGMSLAIPLKGRTSLPRNMGIFSASAECLVERYNAGKLQGKLKEIASKLQEDDNPVLMLVKFKE